jgi:hypothetical protein
MERYQDARLRVYVVWVKRWALDTRAEIDGAGMVDPRVTHLWDAGNVINQEFLDRFGVNFGGWTTTSSCCSSGTPPGVQRRLGR